MEDSLPETDFNEFVLAKMPHFIAVNYQRLLAAQTPLERVELALHIYNLSLRILTIGLVSQYVFQDKGKRKEDPYLNELLVHKFPYLTLETWPQLFFASLRAYEGLQDLLFMPELYDFYWDTSTYPHRRRPEVEQPINRLTQLTADRIRAARPESLLSPQNEDEWAKLAHDETMSLLRQILHHLDFVGRYDLIRVLSYGELLYEFELHKGLIISLGQQHKPRQTKFEPGWFYLRNETAEFLPLHPLLLFWGNEAETSKLMVEVVETGLYNRYIYERLQYLLAVSGKMETDDRGEAFAIRLRNISEEAKNKQEVDKLIWWQLRDLCDKITHQRMGTVRDKYRREWYLPRDKTRQAFLQFLELDKRCFVLIGKSGVGKTNFLLALAEELHQTRSDVCLLMYDGAAINMAASLTQVVSQDFDNHLTLAGRPVEHIWREIAQIDDIEQRRVILCVDAINESQQAKELLRQLDDLVQSTWWPWLKVVFSSRPETWQAIKRGVRLSEALYYREAGLEPRYSEQMEPFSRQELPLAYFNYQQSFKLQTPYQALPSELREMLRDPLNLWLVAKTYPGQAIPPQLKVSALIADYVAALEESDRLRQADLRLLEKQLIPLMVSPGHYHNALTIADIDATGGGLYEAIYSEQVLSDGHRMNEAFTNLLDADILTRQVQGHDQNITFKYERFYEYFIGCRLFEISRSQADRPAFFRDLVGQLTDAPFLWGAIKNALLKEAVEHSPEMLLQLCYTDQQRVKELMVAVLTDLGRDNREMVEEILEKLVPPTEKVGKLQSLRQLLGKMTVTTDKRSPNAKKIAIEVAGNLNIPGILCTAALQADSTIKTWAVRSAYHLWQRDQNAGFEVLEQLTRSATSGLLPNFIALEAIFGLSLVIFFDHPQDEAILKRLQSTWRYIIAKNFGIRERSSQWEKFLRSFIRERFFSLATAVIFQLFRELPKNNVLVNYSDIEAFFRLGGKEKTIYRNLLRYLDPQGNYSNEQMKNDMLNILGVRNVLIQGVAVIALTVHAIKEPSLLLPFLDEFLKEAQKDPVPSPYLTDIPNILTSILERAPELTEVFNFFVQSVEVCQEYYAKYPYIPGYSIPRYAPKASYLGPYVFYEYQRTGTVRTNWLETRINAACVQKDTSFFDLLLLTELTGVGIERRKPQISLDTLALFFDNCNLEIDQMVGSFLSRLRTYYPDEVDNFLEERQVDESFRLQVQTNEPSERVGELIGVWKMWNFFIDEMISTSSKFRTLFTQIFAKAADCKNAREWVDYMLREIINSVYGSEVLRPAK